MTVCKCELCTHGRSFERRVKRVPGKDRPFWEDLYSRYFHMGDDLNYAEAILDGSWPSAVEQLEQALGKAKAMREGKK